MSCHVCAQYNMSHDSGDFMPNQTKLEVCRQRSWWTLIFLFLSGLLGRNDIQKRGHRLLLRDCIAFAWTAQALRTSRHIRHYNLRHILRSLETHEVFAVPPCSMQYLRRKAASKTAHHLAGHQISCCSLLRRHRTWTDEDLFPNGALPQVPQCSSCLQSNVKASSCIMHQGIPKHNTNPHQDI